MKIKRIEKIVVAYHCICAGSSVHEIGDKINEIIDSLNKEWDCKHEVTTLSQDNCNKCGKSILDINGED